MSEGINVNEQLVDDSELDEGNTYAVLVAADRGIQRDGNRKDINFNDGDGRPRSITLFSSSTPDKAYEKRLEKETTYRITGVRFTTNSSNGRTYFNLNTTSDSTIEVVEDKKTLDEQIGDRTVEEHMNDGLVNSDDKSYSNETGHVATLFKSDDYLDSLTVIEYKLVASAETTIDGNHPYEARRELYSLTDESIPIAFGPESDDRIYTTEELDTVGGEKFSIEKIEERGLDLASDSDRLLAQELIQEVIKLDIDSSYFTVGIDSIRKKDIEYSTDSFKLRKEFKLSPEVKQDGYVYLSAYFKHRISSDITVDELSRRGDLYSGLKVKPVYGGRGYIFNCLSDEYRATDTIPNEINRSVLEWHRQKQSVSEERLDEIEQANRKVAVVWDSKTDEERYFPQALLNVQPTPKQLESLDSEFSSEMRSRVKLSADKCKNEIRSFIEDNQEFSAKGISVEFSSTLFSGDENKRLERLYDPDENVLTSGSGPISHPRDLFEDGLTVLSRPDSYHVGIVAPDTQGNSVWEGINDQLKAIGASPDNISKYTYDKEETPDIISMNVLSELGDVDTILAVLPPEEMVALGDIVDAGELYETLKKDLATEGINSQMIYINNNSNNFTLRNAALSLFASAGGIPYSIENQFSDHDELFIGIDVTRQYVDDEQVNVSSAATAIYGDGTTLGYTTGDIQAGEKIQPEDIREIVRQSITEYKREHGENPDSVTIHRDGFMNEKLGPVVDFLESIDVKCNVVEIRKTPSLRILKYDGMNANAPEKGIALIDDDSSAATVATFGEPEVLAGGGGGLPRPLRVEKVRGSSSIEEIVKQVYLLSQSHVQVHNTTARLPITTDYADKISDRDINGQLVVSSGLEDGLGFL